MNNEPSISIFQSLTIGVSNISGLQSKLDGSSPDVELNSFMSFVQTFHVICCLESWAYKLNQFVLEGYECYDVICKKHFKAFRNHAAIAVFIKKGCYNMSNI